MAGSPRDAGDRAAASRNKSASAPPRAWKEKETGLFFCSTTAPGQQHPRGVNVYQGPAPVTAGP